MTAYADTQDLEYRLSATYAVPQNAEQLLAKASELIEEATLGRSAIAWESEDGFLREALARATCDQVEYWLEVGEEHDVVGMKGSMVAGRVQVHPVPPALGPRALRSLMRAGLAWRAPGTM